MSVNKIRKIEYSLNYNLTFTIKKEIELIINKKIEEKIKEILLEPEYFKDKPFKINEIITDKWWIKISVEGALPSTKPSYIAQITKSILGRILTKEFNIETSIFDRSYFITTVEEAPEEVEKFWKKFIEKNNK